MRNYKRSVSNISSHRSDSELEISTSKQPQTLEEQFTLWINTLNANLSKKLYKNVFQDINSNIKKYYSLSIHYKAIVLKIRTMIKIIETKGRKYTLSNVNDAKSKFQLSRINQYTSMIINDIDYLIDIIEKDNDINIIEDVIFLFASLLYTKAVIYKQMNKVITSLSILSIIVYNLSKNMLNIITNVDTLIIINKAMLLIANYLIQNKDYDNSITLISQSISFSLRVLHFIIDYNEPIEDEKYDNKTQRRIHKLIANIIIAYYDRGVIFENKCDILNAVNNYKQCRYLSSSFLTSEKYTSIRKMIRKLFNRALSYYDTINYLIDKSELYEQTKKRNHSMRKLGNRYNIDSLQLKKVAEGNIYHNKRYDKTLHTISSLVIPEIDMVNRYKKKKETKNDYILSNVRLLDALMSDEFKGMVKSMDKIKLCDYDNSTKEKIQKLVNKMHYDKTMRAKNSNTNTYNNDTMFTFNNFNNTNDRSFRLSSNKKTMFNKSQPTLYYFNRNNNSITTATSNLRNSKSYSLLSSSVKRSKQTTSRNQSVKAKKVEQYKIDEEIFIESYRNKKKYLNALNEKELKFQRELLRLKTKENINDIVNSDIDVDHIKQDAKLLYDRLISMIDEKKNDPNKKLSTEEIGEIRRSTMVRNSVIKSQNEKAFRISMMDENKKNEEHVVYCDDEDMIAQLSDRTEVTKRNKDMIEKLNNKIYMIKHKQKEHHRSNSVINI